MNDAAAPAARRRRRAAGPELVIIYWRDIPLQVKVEAGGQRGQKVLPNRFQRAADRAAMVAELTTADGYVRQMRRVAAPCEDDIDQVLARVTQELKTDYTRDRLAAIVTNAGWESTEPATLDDTATLDGQVDR